jgi:hypothetical protein
MRLLKEKGREPVSWLLSKSRSCRSGIVASAGGMLHGRAAAAEKELRHGERASSQKPMNKKLVPD